MADMLMTKAEAAKRLTVSTQTVTRMVHDGRLVAVSINGRRVAITTASVEAIIHPHPQQEATTNEQC